MQVERGNKRWLQQYFKAPKPMGYFSYGLHTGPQAQWLANERLKLVAAWMGAQSGDRALPYSAVKALEDHERSGFVSGLL